MSDDLIKQAGRLLNLARRAISKIEDVQSRESHLYRHAEVDWLLNASPEIDAWLKNAGAEPGVTFSDAGAMMLSGEDRKRIADAWGAIWNTAIFELVAEGPDQRIVNSRANEVEKALRAAKIVR